ncbi:hypothetical protein [Mesorhizobium sp.]|uniref:hypothetical protein n=1 Tax=Mesorhizobium sp. TaxID=1871066 RepID=UPI0025D7D70B|nr:hypothetical protein [Mesorhizobium sp.]
MKDKVVTRETDAQRFNETLKRMLKTPPKPNVKTTSSKNPVQSPKSKPSKKD